LFGTCVIYGCIQREKFCGHLIQCMVNIPDESVKLQNIPKFNQKDNWPVSCSSVHWMWTILKAQEGNLNIYLQSNNWVN